MIKHHPPQAMLKQYANGELSAPLAAAVAIHVEMCPECKHQVMQYTVNEADDTWQQQSKHTNSDLAYELDGSNTMDPNVVDLDAMIEQITADDSQQSHPCPASLSVEVNKNQYQLPRALNSLNIHKFNGFGKISRAKIDLDDEGLHTHLLHMEPQGEVPKHTHKGFELTLLLSGSFEDDFGDYHPGDFILLDSQHNHQPRSVQGCLCYTVVSEPLKFTKGLSQLLNPIGRYIY